MPTIRVPELSSFLLSFQARCPNTIAGIEVSGPAKKEQIKNPVPKRKYFRLLLPIFVMSIQSITIAAAFLTLQSKLNRLKSVCINLRVKKEGSL